MDISPQADARQPAGAAHVITQRHAQRTDGPPRSRQPQGARRALLACGVLASLLYVAMNIGIPLQWPAYSTASQTVSELSAVGAPTRGLWVGLGAVYTALMLAFSLGLQGAANGLRRLRILADLMLAYALVSTAWPFFPMHQRAVLASGGSTTSDTLHLAFAAITVVLMLLAMGFGAASFGKRFRNYTIASMVLLAVFGLLTVLQAPNVDADLPTPWIGVWERTNIGIFLVWVIVLAVALWPARTAGTP